MDKKSRILILTASLLLIGIYFTPLWMISLEAPQYPEGLYLYIGVDEIYGSEDATIQNFNLLNHYIGMKDIEPDAIPELKFMPYIVAFFIAFGLLIFLLKKPKLIYVWVILIIITGIAGLVDFYLWEYDYGHNLSDKAAIKLKGMTYQPPMFGTKQLLNFVAGAWPQAGAYFFGFSVLSGIAASFFQFKSNKNKNNEKAIS